MALYIYGFLCKYIARFIVTLSYEYQVTSLEALQKNLVEEWGQQIKHPPNSRH
jgi:hypothetical protein